MTARRSLLNVLLLGPGLLAWLGLPGCGVYSASSGRVEESLKRVAVQYLENQTAEPNLGTELADLIVAAIQADNTLKVVGEEAADSIISGRVVQYDLKEAFARGDLTVTEYQVQIAVVLSFVVKATGDEKFSEKQFTGVGNYVLDDPQGTSEETAKVEAIDQIVRDILAQVVEDW